MMPSNKSRFRVSLKCMKSLGCFGCVPPFAFCLLTKKLVVGGKFVPNQGWTLHPRPPRIPFIQSAEEETKPKIFNSFHLFLSLGSSTGATAAMGGLKIIRNVIYSHLKNYITKEGSKNDFCNLEEMGRHVLREVCKEWSVLPGLILSATSFLNCSAIWL